MRLRFDLSLIDHEPGEVVASAWRQREALRSLADRLGEPPSVTT